MTRGASVLLLVMLWMALPSGALASPRPSVDLGVRELKVEKLMAISRRTDTDWWALAEVKVAPQMWLRQVVYRSADSGRSWHEDRASSESLSRSLVVPSFLFEKQYSPSVDFFVWYTPEIGLMAGYLGAAVLRTSDGGRSWHSVAFPRQDPTWIYDLERAGPRTWICGSSGTIYRSDDSGASWLELKGTPFTSEDRCMSLSFLDAERGWAAGMRGSLWATKDGGTTWRRIETPWPPAPARGPATMLREVTLLTPQVAWLQGSAGRFQTTDGGTTWNLRPPAPEERDASPRVTTLAGGRRIITWESSKHGGAVHARTPAFGEPMTVMGADTLVKVRGRLLHTLRGGRLVRTSPLTTPGSGALTRLDGLETAKPTTWTGWKGAQVMLSHDQGRSWFSVGRVPEAPLRSLSITEDDVLVAWAQSQRSFASSDFGLTWGQSTAESPALATGVPLTEQEYQLHCLLNAPEAAVKVRFGLVGCNADEENHLALEVSNARALLSGKYPARKKPLTVQSRVLSPDEARRFLRALVAAATREEKPLGCESNSRYRAVLEWSCSPGSSVRHSLEYEAEACGPRTHATLVGEAMVAGDSESEGYARALGVHDLAARALEGTLP
ncbi:hypothetical protein MYSTI_02071 [Myxococcus stipitatus DSM 14675]|uniref:Photosynthesis system II assembly factor Ycf48/Hcf136-like domain-containing protein n=1 Tax=Myxococcus stipitatus (strain DSM 14675 / JCM 12634 / Mx s8) TaxID=1278073 RepID=L7U6C1_MYXSD|nr:hypothetical protein [Myxococcus stipitatus]AGC43400.1 hypothetical protein MYSTI_02071 [Myxococcus stipitatus DSM 14675]